jgi:DNA repair protein RecO (recombination protein O)
LKVELTPAFVLHQRPYRENSALLDVFSEQYGRVSIVAKSLNQKKGNKAGLLQLYQPLLLSWFGHGDLYLLTAVEALSARYILQADAALCGLYINELIVKLLGPHVAEPEVFNAYQQTLLSLHQRDNTEIILRLFEKNLLGHLGYGLVLDSEYGNGLLVEDQQQYYYKADAGLMRWQQGVHLPMISGRSLRHLINESDFDQQSLQEIKRVMRTVIYFYLGGKPLQSRQLFIDLQQYASKN